MSRNILYAIIAILIIFAVVLLLASNQNKDMQNAVISPVPSPSVTTTEVTDAPDVSPTDEVSPTTTVPPTIQVTTSPTP